MAKIEITLINSQNGQSYPAEVVTDKPVGWWIDQILQAVGLPREEQGRRIEYQFVLERTGQVVGEKDMLQSVDLQAEDELRLETIPAKQLQDAITGKVSNRESISRKGFWPSLLLIGLGWVVAGILAQIVARQIGHQEIVYAGMGALGGLIGLAIGIALRLQSRSFKAIYILIGASVWGIGSWLAFTISYTAGAYIDPLRFDSMSIRTIVDILTFTLTGIMGGSVTGALLKISRPSLPWSRVLIIILGWVAGCLSIGILRPNGWYDFFYSTPENFVWWLYIVVLLIGGLLGGWIMFWQLEKEN